MQAKKLEALVKDSFNMNLHDFIRNKIETEGLYDYEVARMLNVSSHLIWRLRNIYGIKRSNGGFVRRFEKKHGKGSIEIFKCLIENPYYSLLDVGKYFGYSKENTRLLHQKIYGIAYTKTHQWKLRVKKRIREQYQTIGKNRKQPFSVIRVMEKARDLGLPFVAQHNGNKYDAIINGYKVNIKSAYHPTKSGDRKHLKFNLFSISKNTKKREACDFFVCFCQNNGNSTFYIIPYDFMPRMGASLPVLEFQGDISNRGIENVYHVRGSKYSKFNEAWHQLTEDKKRKVSNM